MTAFAVAVVGPGDDQEPTRAVGILIVNVVAGAGAAAVGTHGGVLLEIGIECGIRTGRSHTTVMAGVAKVGHTGECPRRCAGPQHRTLGVVRHMAELADLRLRRGSNYSRAADGEVVNMTHLINATKREYQKMGKVVVDGEFGEYGSHTGI